jgi:hypothetical protein
MQQTLPTAQQHIMYQLSFAWQKSKFGPFGFTYDLAYLYFPVFKLVLICRKHWLIVSTSSSTVEALTVCNQPLPRDQHGKERRKPAHIRTGEAISH